MKSYRYDYGIAGGMVIDLMQAYWPDAAIVALSMPTLQNP
jgi:hypothetical protein